MKMKAVLLGVLFASIHLYAYPQSPAAFVDPMTGTGGFGHTFPGACLPYGMVQLSPDTRRDASWEGCGGYYHSDSLIYGFSHTHLSGTGVSDYGDILVMPAVAPPSFEPALYGSGFRHQDEKARPGYYAVTLTDENLRAEMTATTRTGLHRYTFPPSERKHLLIDLRHRDKVLEAYIRIMSNRRIEGLRRSEGWARDQYVFFVMEFSEPVQAFRSNGDKRDVQPGEVLRSDSLCMVLEFAGSTNGSLLVKTALSTADTEGASRNLQTELPGWDFEIVMEAAREAWNKELGRIEVKGGAQEDKVNFYTALYHAMVAPNVISDVDGRYRGRDLQVHTAHDYTRYTVFSLWDTFRAAHPLYTLIDRKRTLDYVRTFLEQYREGGRLPVWELAANETDCMIGYHSVPVITDALMKGITGIDTALALEAMIKSATWNHLGIPAYIRNGYIAVEDEHESVSKTLEYAFDDWCISETARLLGREEERKRYLIRAASYRNLFDPQTGFMRPRRNGDFIPNFDPREVNNHFTEANSWQYSFFVPHDLKGLITLMGGEQPFEAKLDQLFAEDSRTTGRSQADITGLVGQYAHGNEPSHHMTYLYNYIGKPWKTQRLVRQILDSLYHPGPGGLPGNEDCGQMSAWFVWSAMGFYPVTPGSNEYAIGSPLFDEVRLHLENGHTVRILAEANGTNSRYVERVSVDGREWNSNLISYGQFTTANEIRFTMSTAPATRRGTASESASMDPSPFCRAPRITADSRLFTDSMLVRIESPDGKPVLIGHNSALVLMGQPYRAPFYLHQSDTIYAQCADAGCMSGISSASFYRIPERWKVSLLTTPNRQYSAEGPISMIDGLKGTENWRKGDWHGYQSTDMEVVIDMGDKRSVNSVSCGFLQDTRSWILMPREMQVLLSEDGRNWKEAGKAANHVEDKNYEVQRQVLKVDVDNRQVRYVKVKAINYGVLPGWHAGAGFDAFIFADEIEIR